jgi:hypothetical protein
MRSLALASLHGVGPPALSALLRAAVYSPANPGKRSTVSPRSRGFQSEGRQIRHQPFGDTGPSTSLQPLGCSKSLQFAQFCVAFGES